MSSPHKLHSHSLKMASHRTPLPKISSSNVSLDCSSMHTPRQELEGSTYVQTLDTSAETAPTIQIARSQSQGTHQGGSVVPTSQPEADAIVEEEQRHRAMAPKAAVHISRAQGPVSSSQMMKEMRETRVIKTAVHRHKQASPVTRHISVTALTDTVSRELFGDSNERNSIHPTLGSLNGSPSIITVKRRNAANTNNTEARAGKFSERSNERMDECETTVQSRLTSSVAVTTYPHSAAPPTTMGTNDPAKDHDTSSRPESAKINAVTGPASNERQGLLSVLKKSSKTDQDSKSIAMSKASSAASRIDIFEVPGGPSKASSKKRVGRPRKSVNVKRSIRKRKHKTCGDDQSESESADDFQVFSKFVQPATARSTRGSRSTGPLLELPQNRREGPRNQSSRSSRGTCDVVEMVQEHNDVLPLAVSDGHNPKETVDDFMASVTNMMRNKDDEPHDLDAVQRNNEQPLSAPHESNAESTNHQLEDARRLGTTMIVNVPVQRRADRCAPDASIQYEEVKSRGTQNSPVLLGDDGEGTSDGDEPVSRKKGSPISRRAPDPTKGSSHPQMPLDFTSSPPAKSYNRNRLTTNDLRLAERDAAIHKPHVIGFDREGPKNQGVVSGKKSANPDMSHQVGDDQEYVNMIGQQKPEHSKRSRSSAEVEYLDESAKEALEDILRSSKSAKRSTLIVESTRSPVRAVSGGTPAMQTIPRNLEQPGIAPDVHISRQPCEILLQLQDIENMPLGMPETTEAGGLFPTPSDAVIPFAEQPGIGAVVSTHLPQFRNHFETDEALVPTKRSKLSNETSTQRIQAVTSIKAHINEAQGSITGSMSPRSMVDGSAEKDETAKGSNTTKHVPCERHVKVLQARTSMTEKLEKISNDQKDNYPVLDRPGPGFTMQDDPSFDTRIDKLEKPSAGRTAGFERSNGELELGNNMFAQDVNPAKEESPMLPRTRKTSQPGKLKQFQPLAKPPQNAMRTSKDTQVFTAPTTKQYSSRDASEKPAQINTVLIEHQGSKRSVDKIHKIVPKRTRVTDDTQPPHSLNQLPITGVRVEQRSSQRRITEEGSPIRPEQEESYSQQHSHWEGESEDELGAARDSTGYFTEAPINDVPVQGVNEDHDDDHNNGTGDDGSIILREASDFTMGAASKPVVAEDNSQTISHAGFAHNSSDQLPAQHSPSKDMKDFPVTRNTTQEGSRSQQLEQQPERSLFSRLRSEVRQNKAEQVQEINEAKDDDAADDPDITLVNDRIDTNQEEQAEEDRSSRTSESSSEPEPRVRFANDPSTWVQALKPHQRPIHNSLFRLTHELLRHLVEAETAIGDIVQDYNEDCLWLLDNLKNCYKRKLEDYVKTTTDKQNDLVGGFNRTATRIDKNLKEVELSREAQLRKQTNGDDALSVLEGILYDLA